MDVIIYDNVVDIQLQSMIYLTLNILYQCLTMYKHNNHADNWRYYLQFVDNDQLLRH